MLRRLDQFIGRLPRLAVASIVAALIAAVAALQLNTGPLVSASIFYLAPIFIATWYVGRLSGYVAASVSAALWLAADMIPRTEDLGWMLPAWNTFVRFSFFWIVVKLLVELKRRLELERELAATDPLTGANNLRAFCRIASAEIERSRRYGRPFSVAYMDLDNFKAVNDQRGHQIGDAVLRTVVQTLRTTTRRTDAVARVGGDEFAVLFPEMNIESARPAVDKIRRQLNQVMSERGWPVTVSIGVVTYTRPPENIEAMIGRADALMYEVKREGKDAATHAQWPSPETLSA